MQVRYSSVAMHLYLVPAPSHFDNSTCCLYQTSNPTTYFSVYLQFSCFPFQCNFHEWVYDLSIWPIQLFCLILTVLTMYLSSWTMLRMSSVVLFSFQLTIIIPLHIHISNAYSLFMSSCNNVTNNFTVSNPYSITLHMEHLTILLFSIRPIYILPLENSFFFTRVFFPIAILLSISVWQVQSSVITGTYNGK